MDAAGFGKAVDQLLIGPVSYTHLDVYKRQTRNIPDNVSALKAEVDMHVRLAKAVIAKDVALAQRLIEKDHMSTRNCIISHFDEIEALQMECCRDFAEFGHSVNM